MAGLPAIWHFVRQLTQQVTRNVRNQDTISGLFLAMVFFHSIGIYTVRHLPNMILCNL